LKKQKSKVPSKTIEGHAMNRKKPNIIVIVADALRPDHLSCYGYHRLTSHHLDGFAEECVVFDSAFSASPSTVSSIPCLVTGLCCSLHGTGVDGNILTLNSKITTMPELLKRAGYVTVAFNTNPLVVGKHGYGRGYDERFETFPSDNEKQLVGSLRHWSSGAEETESIKFHRPYTCSRKVNEKVAEWLQSNTGYPFFMWLHYMDTHSPYFPRDPYFTRYAVDHPGNRVVTFLRKFENLFGRLHHGAANLTAEEKQLIVDCYDSEIGYLDAGFGELLAMLRHSNLLDNTVIFVTADHGEEFWEHSAWGHYIRMYDFNLRVPLLLKHPDVAEQRRITTQVRNIDMLPTILEIIGAAPPQPLSGTSLLPYIYNEAQTPELPVIAEGGGVKRLSTDEFVDRLYAVRTAEYKYIKNTTKNELQLYNLKDDPLESNNLAHLPGRDQIIVSMEARMNETLRQPVKADFSAEQPDLDSQMLERLRALGYA